MSTNLVVFRGQEDHLVKSNARVSDRNREDAPERCPEMTRSDYGDPGCPSVRPTAAAPRLGERRESDPGCAERVAGPFARSCLDVAADDHEGVLHPGARGRSRWLRWRRELDQRVLVVLPQHRVGGLTV